ncbi:hypothetical protein Tco_0371568 [Tanacetum coccineum]
MARSSQTWLIDHKESHDGDDDDDDDDEGPSAGSKPESSKGKDPNVGSKTSKSAPAKDPVEEPTEKVLMDELPTEDILISDEGHVSDPEDTDNAHMPKILDTTTWFRPILEEEDLLLLNPNGRIGKEELSKADLEGPTFMMVKGFHKNNISLQFQMEECHKLLINPIDLVNPEGHRIVPNISNPLPLGGPPGQVTIQPQFFFNKDLEYLLTGDKERNRALSISKLKAALYQDFGLEELVPSLWIESEQIPYANSQCYSIKTYERYGYNYLREIVLRRADYNEYKISEKDFKSLHPNDFEDLNILHIQGKLDHLPKQDKVNLHNAVSLWTRNIVIRKRVEDLQLGIESYQTKLNLEQPNWDASDFPFKEDYTIVFKPRAFNKGMENRKWTEDDKRRSEDFIEVIERRLKIRRIFESESFVGGRLRDINYRLISRTE